MNTYQLVKLGHRFGRTAIEQRLTDIALLTREIFPYYAWECNQEWVPPVMHRVHIFIAGHKTSLEFTNQEVLTYSQKMRRCAIDYRMKNVFDKALDTALDG